MRLMDAGPRLQEALYAISALKEKWGALVVHLPHTLFFNAKTAEPFLDQLRSLYSGTLLWEPQNQSWCSDKAIDLLNQYKVDKVHADPEVCVIGPDITLSENNNYYRLHGKPKLYESKYSTDYLSELADKIKTTSPTPYWLIFNNMVDGNAFDNAHELQKLLSKTL